MLATENLLVPMSLNMGLTSFFRGPVSRRGFGLSLCESKLYGIRVY